MDTNLNLGRVNKIHFSFILNHLASKVEKGANKSKNYGNC
jgi:hypothetical protein